MENLDLKIFAKTCEPEVYSQVYRLMNLHVFRESKVRIMPDTHAGVGCVVGFTANLGDKAVPNLVGVDIGCGMFVENLGKADKIDLDALDRFIRENIPSGSSVNERQGTKVEFPLEELIMYKDLRNIPHLQSSIGSLGGGNHFIELNKNAMDEIFLVIHTGSRNLGQQVCKYYQKMAIVDCNSHTKEIKEEIKAGLEMLEKEGRKKDASKMITEIKERYKRIDKVPTDLCYLEGAHLKDYLHDMKVCQEFASKNREEIARRIIGHLRKNDGLIPSWGFQTVHNYIDFTDNIIRKGAIRCNKDEMVIITLNMRDGSIIGIGKGNPDWNNSGPHGAGRLMSRREAKENISMNEFKESMQGIFTTSVNKNTIDESPMAYKDAQEIIEQVQDTIEVKEIIKPIYNFKASETEEDYKIQNDEE